MQASCTSIHLQPTLNRTHRQRLQPNLAPRAGNRPVEGAPTHLPKFLTSGTQHPTPTHQSKQQYVQFQGPPLTQQQQYQQQYQQPTLQFLPGAHPPLKYAQMGHSNFGRGAPHVCYVQMGTHGMFYSRAHQQEHQQQQQQQQPPPSWGHLAASIAHAAASILQTGRRGGSILAAAAVGAGAGAAAEAGLNSSGAAPPSSHASAVGVQPDGSCSTGTDPVGPQWHVVVLQGLLLAAAVVVAGQLLKQFLRGAVATLVACYSGLLFKT